MGIQINFGFISYGKQLKSNVEKFAVFTGDFLGLRSCVGPRQTLIRHFTTTAVANHQARPGLFDGERGGNS